MRCAWRTGFPPAFVHCDYARDLKSHPDYARAKRGGDTEAAYRLIVDLHREIALDRVADALVRRRTVVVAPARGTDPMANAIAPTFAAWLARELDLDLHGGIFVEPRPARDLSDGWERLANQSVFYGRLPPDSDFIIADDVCTIGGTIADLRSFIDSAGGRVVCATVLAADRGEDVPLAIAPTTKFSLEREYGPSFDAFLWEEFGYGIDCLTEREAQLLRGKGPGLDRLRAALARAADALHARRGAADRR